MTTAAPTAQSLIDAVYSLPTIDSRQTVFYMNRRVMLVLAGIPLPPSRFPRARSGEDAPLYVKGGYRFFPHNAKVRRMLRRRFARKTDTPGMASGVPIRLAASA